MAESREFLALKEAYEKSQANQKVQASPVSDPSALQIPPFSGEDLQLIQGDTLILPAQSDLEHAFFSKTFGTRPSYFLLCTKRRADGSVVPFELWLASLTRKVYRLKEGKLPTTIDDQKVMNCGTGLIEISASMSAAEYKPLQAFSSLAGREYPVVANFRVETYGRDAEGRTDYDKHTYKLMYQLAKAISEAALGEIPTAKETEEAIATAKAALTGTPAGAAATGAKGNKKSNKANKQP